MPIHLNDTDVVSKVEGLKSALIVACNMCAGVSVSTRENKPFIQLFRSLRKSPPLEKHIKELQSKLKDNGVNTKTFKTNLLFRLFICIWPSSQRQKLFEDAKKYEAVIVLGCDSAMETIHDSVKATNCKVIPGMEFSGIMNTKPKFHFPGNISFVESKTISMCNRNCEHYKPLAEKPMP